jgi:hypothetical protein
MRFRRRRQTFDSPPRPIDLMFAEMLGLGGMASPVARATALQVPAVLRGRNFVCSPAALPLREYDPENAVVDSPLLRQIDPDVPNLVTIAQTLEDLLFDSISWWLITAVDFTDYPVAARHLDVNMVALQPPLKPPLQNPAPLPSGRDPRGATVWVDGHPVAASRVIRFDSANPPLRIAGARAINRALALDRAANMYADDPRPLDYFTPAEGADPIDDDESKRILNEWKAARKARTTAYVPAALDYHAVDTPSPADLQLVELQRQSALEISNALGLDAEEFGVSTTSRTYRNDVDRRRTILNETLEPYLTAITARLSMGDVTRRGHTVRFDTSTYLQPNPTERWANYATAKGLGAMTVEEIREAEGMAPLPPGESEPQPAVDSVVVAGEQAPVAGAGDDGDRIAAASSSPALTFDGPATFSLAVPVAEFSVDVENRIIEGLAVPWNQMGHKDGLTFTFSPGSLQWAPDDPGRVKLYFPRHGEAVGRAIALENRDGGLFSRFKVGRGPDGDRALMAAEDRVFDGLSVGVDFDTGRDATRDRSDQFHLHVHRADLRHVALTDEPVFDNARVTRVAASRTEGGHVPATEPTGNGPTEPEPAPTEPTPAPADPGAPEPPGEPASGTFTADQVQAMFSAAGLTPNGHRQLVDPTRGPRITVQEPGAYRFDRRRNFIPGQEFVFSADLHAMVEARDMFGEATPEGRRVMDLIRREFTILPADIDELTPAIQRPDMYVDQEDFRFPIWSAIDKGAPPNGIQPFVFPKFATATGLVQDHVTGTEPASGDFTTTGQTVTPTPVSGKASITREVWDMGGNPAVSTLIFNQMVKGYREGLESAAATFLNTLTAATDINLGVAATDAAFTLAWEQAVAGLNFVRSYDYSVMVVDQTTYLKAVGARDTSGRPYWPQIGPMNANGTVQNRFTSLNAAGVQWFPSWALPSTPGSPNNSWLFDPSHVHGWATVPQRLQFEGTGAAGVHAPVAFVDLAIWGYKALANDDIGGVRQVIYDSV